MTLSRIICLLCSKARPLGIFVQEWVSRREGLARAQPRAFTLPDVGHAEVVVAGGRNFAHAQEHDWQQSQCSKAERLC